MANYKPDLSCQNKFIPINFSQQVIPGTFEYALAHIVDNHLDLSGFDNWYHNDKTGAAAYSPSVMLKTIMFAYSRGIISSRKIAIACETNDSQVFQNTVEFAICNNNACVNLQKKEGDRCNFQMSLLLS
jgi:hypothetical protein